MGRVAVLRLCGCKVIVRGTKLWYGSGRLRREDFAAFLCRLLTSEIPDAGTFVSAEKGEASFEDRENLVIMRGWRSIATFCPLCGRRLGCVYGFTICAPGRADARAAEELLRRKSGAYVLMRHLRRAHRVRARRAGRIKQEVLINRRPVVVEITVYRCLRCNKKFFGAFDLARHYLLDHSKYGRLAWTVRREKDAWKKAEELAARILRL